MGRRTMSEELKPCPACGATGCNIEITRGQVVCWNCLAQGSAYYRTADAVKQWNAMQRPLRWTNEPPKYPGLYWVRDYGKRIHIVDVGCDMTEYEPQPYREWAGPIPEPEEK